MTRIIMLLYYSIVFILFFCIINAYKLLHNYIHYSVLYCIINIHVHTLSIYYKVLECVDEFFRPRADF